MVKERILAVPYTTVFIAQLPKETQDIIREDMKLHARENGYRLEWDAEARDYIGMTRRFCDIEEIYAHTKVDFCEPGENLLFYERCIRRDAGCPWKEWLMNRMRNYSPVILEL